MARREYAKKADQAVITKPPIIKTNLDLGRLIIFQHQATLSRHIQSKLEVDEKVMVFHYDYIKLLESYAH